MLKRVVVHKKTIERYAPFIADADRAELERLSRELKGVRLLHLNSTAAGGGVAELLNSLVPLECAVGVQAEWRVMHPDNDFFAITKGFHNALQGDGFDLTAAGQSTYLRHNERCARDLRDRFDAIIAHDPQTAAMHHYAPENHARWAWRCHIDTSVPHAPVWSFLRPYVEEHDAVVFTLPAFVPADLEGPRRFFIPPAIDPLSPKNRALPRFLCRDEVADFGVDLERPLVIQVSRFDPWKDPQGVIDAYRIVKESIPEVQLALIGAMADDDPQGWEIYNQIREQGDNDPDLYLFTNLTGVGAHEVNAFQRVADVAVQKSTREGFGLVVSEALWKETPVVGGNTGGIPLQMGDGVGGFLVNSVAECADRIGYLLTHPDESELIAHRGRHHIQEKFLMHRLLLDELRMVQSMLQA